MSRAGLDNRHPNKDGEISGKHGNTPLRWVLMPTGKSPVHTDADRDIGIHGYCFFQVVNG